MDAEKLLQAFSTDEARELAAALPDDVFRDEVSRRGLEVAAVVGVAATGATVEAEPAKSEFETRVANFLNPEARLDASDQLTVMREFWNKLGYDLPTLDEGEQARLLKAAERHPDRRIVPTPLLTFDQRKAIAETAREAFPAQQFTPNSDALWTPDVSWLYGKLLRDPGSAVKDGRKTYALGYKTPDGEIATRREYMGTLVDAEQSVEAADGTTWIFPVMDVRVQSPRTNARADNLHQKIDPIDVPESGIAMQLLHKANGTPNPEWHVDFVNEAIFEVEVKGKGDKQEIIFTDKNGETTLVSVASVGWDPIDRQVYLYSWDAGDRDGDFGVRGAESGL